MKEEIQKKAKEALKGGDKIALEALRSLISALQYAEMSLDKKILTDSDCMTIIKQELKKRSEEIEFLIKAKKQDVVAKVEHEISVIKQFLPPQVDAQQIQQFLSSSLESIKDKNIGEVMKVLKDKFKDTLDGKTASNVVKTFFENIKK
jgi:uncharacterized protein